MLKLMRLEESSVFAIVDDEQFESEMEILGYVRMNYKNGMNYIKTFKEHNEEWFAELNGVIKEREKNMTSEVKYTRRTLKLENIVIQYLREKDEQIVKITVIKKLVLYLFSEINRRGLLFNFRDYYQLNDGNIEKHLQGCKRVSIDGDYIRINNYYADILCFNPNTAVDSRIKEMIGEFIAKEKKE